MSVTDSAPSDTLDTSLARAAGDDLVVAGGSDGATHTTDSFLLTYQDGRLVRLALPALPEAPAMGAGAVLDRTMYVVGGQLAPEATSASAHVWAIDPDRPGLGWRAVPPLPGAGRILPVVVAQAGALHVFSGASLEAAPDGTARRTYLADAWAYRPSSGWARLANAPRPVVAAPGVSWGQSHIFVDLVSEAQRRRRTHLVADGGRRRQRPEHVRQSVRGGRRKLLAPSGSSPRTTVATTRSATSSRARHAARVPCG